MTCGRGNVVYTLKLCWGILQDGTDEEVSEHMARQFKMLIECVATDVVTRRLDKLFKREWKKDDAAGSDSQGD